MTLQLIDTIPVHSAKECHSYRYFRKLRALLKKQKWGCPNCSAFAFEIGIYYNIKNHGFIIRYHTIDSNGKLSYMTKDHIIPKSKEGKNNNLNIQILCENCNQKKADKLIERSK